MAVFSLTKLENICEDIDRRCRTCLGICAEFNDLSKYVVVGDCKMSLIELISNCASVQISERNGLPQRICETCKETAIKSHLFKLQCETTEKYLEGLSQNLIFKSHFTPKKEVLSTTTETRVATSLEDNRENSFSENLVKIIEKSLNENEDTSKNEINQIKHEETEQTHVCDSCNEIFPSENALIKHLKIQKHKCVICELTFHDANEYTIHKSQHRTEADRENVKKRTCPYCNKIFQHRTSMLKHQRKHNAPPKQCIFCKFNPTSPSAMSKHMEQMHAHLKTFTCSLCNKAFFKKANLRLHIQIHSGVKKHTCEICGISFNLRGNLLVHRRLHTGERPYTCSVCGRGFTQQSALRSHEAGHSDKRDHVCPECGAAFSRAGALRNHRKRHSSVKPFECSICGKKFTFSSERKRHMSIHSGDKNHECEVCGKRFSRNENLKVHKRIHTGETPHVCSVCGKEFIQAHCLRTHMNAHMVPLV